MERLRQEGAIFPISASSSFPCHLLYADAILIFLKAHKASMWKLQGLLSLYQDSSGQSFNLLKSQLFLGNCNARRANMVSGLLEINKATFPSVYLRIPLFFGSARHPYFKKVLDSTRLRLAGWKTKLLSFAGRLTLVRHFLASIPLYNSLVLPLPFKTCLLIERMMRNFLW